VIKFNKIENAEIFTRDFRPLVKNNEIDFPTSEKIVVIYGPNGTGKTSLIKVLLMTKARRLSLNTTTKHIRLVKVYFISLTTRTTGTSSREKQRTSSSVTTSGANLNCRSLS
jgi:recombinational DNA repair ATPase RecF